jgi:hypothetical protein
VPLKQGEPGSICCILHSARIDVTFSSNTVTLKAGQTATVDNLTYKLRNFEEFLGAERTSEILARDRYRHQQTQLKLMTLPTIPGCEAFCVTREHWGRERFPAPRKFAWEVPVRVGDMLASWNPPADSSSRLTFRKSVVLRHDLGDQ